MNFLKRMKTRERVELSLKTIAAVIVGIALIFLMEGMIFSIYMSKINENKASQFIPTDCVAYCEEVKEGEYKIYLHDSVNGAWSVRSANFTQEQIEQADYAEVVYGTPTPFDVSITNTHYIVMAIFISAILGFYGWRFYKLTGDYKKLEKRLRVKGTIF
jgi:hypothetical protein